MSLPENSQSISRPLHGMWRIIPSPALTELLAQAGLDFQILDCEHGAYDLTTVANDIVACEGQRCAPLVRVGGTNPVDAILAQCHRAGEPVAMMTLRPEATRALVARGVKALVHGVESACFKQAATGERHAALRGFDETDILPFGGHLAPLRIDPSAQVLLTFIPSFPIMPPEAAWMREPTTDIPGLILRETTGGGPVSSRHNRSAVRAQHVAASGPIGGSESANFRPRRPRGDGAIVGKLLRSEVALKQGSRQPGE